jgi:uncharacterized hydrophobic protein (TIGR00341 family)
MRLVEIMISAGKREAVLDILEDEGIDYVLTEEASPRSPDTAISFPLPTPAVEPVLERIRAVGMDESSYTVIVRAETVISERFDELEEQYGKQTRSRDRIGREELLAQAKDMTPTFTTYLLLIVISAVVATAGLLVDSSSVVVGSMVIAPLLGPAVGSSVGSVLGDPDLFRRGVTYQAVGLVVGVIAAAGFALFVKTTGLVPPGIDILSISEIQGRVRPDFLSLAVALGAGIAGAWSLASGAAAVIVGVMIAAALVPPLGVVGIGLAFNLPMIALSAAVLVLVNVFTINVTALGVLWYKGYRPESWFQSAAATRATKQRIGLLIAAIVVLSTFLGVVTYDTYRTATFESEATNDIDAVAASSYPSLEVIDTQVEYQDPLPFQQPQRIVVTVGIPPGQNPPPLAAALERRANVFIPAFGLPGVGTIVPGKQVNVEVRYIQRQS